MPSLVNPMMPTCTEFSGGTAIEQRILLPEVDESGIRIHPTIEQSKCKEIE